jgi:hypothetical protein
MQAIVVIALVASAGPAAQAEVSDSAAVASLAGQLKNAHYARIGIDGRTFVLVEPRVAPDGLAFEGVEGFPKARPAIITGAGWDSIAPVPNPVPWSSLQEIEAGNRTRRPGALTGGVVGLVGGLLVGGFYGAMYEMGGQGEGWHFTLGVTALSTVLGMGVGALFPTTTWTLVHHAPQAVTR